MNKEKNEGNKMYILTDNWTFVIDLGGLDKILPLQEKLISLKEQFPLREIRYRKYRIFWIHGYHMNRINKGRKIKVWVPGHWRVGRN